MDDVNYQRGMLYMAANPSLNLPFSSSGGDPSNGSAALLNLYSREVKKFPLPLTHKHLLLWYFFPL